MTKSMSTAELRSAYLDFFAAKGCTRYHSASLVPENDPTILFTVAGMAQFKDMFLGRGSLPFASATTCQKCIRTNDIMNVGRTPRHHTFFEMLGNFSFNDYFKRETITWAWEFLTEVLELPVERLFITVNHIDDDAYNIWTKDVGIPESRIVRLGDDDNFWPASAPTEGPTGPGGCCSEIFWDYQTNANPGAHPGNDDNRFVEIWNLVFPQFNVTEPKVDGRYTLDDLGRTNIDTGAGLERLASVIQGKTNNFDIDLLQIIVQSVVRITGAVYTEGAAAGTPEEEVNALIRRIADHARAVAFCIADGALPGNTGRGYIVRRLIRRATLDLDKLGVSEVSLFKAVPAVVEAMADAYPEVAARQELASETLQAEEKLFRRTLGRGMELLERALARHRESGASVFSGDDCFELFTTYGFPFEITEELVEQAGMTLDRARFDERMDAFAVISKGGKTDDVFTSTALQEAKPRLGATEFVGYSDLDAAVELTLLEVDGAEVAEAGAGTPVRFALNRTPFYAESGGQVGDVGEVTGAGFVIVVEDVQKDDGLVVHSGRVANGLAKPGAVQAAVAADPRRATTQHHSATHLLHSALTTVLGEHVEQQGSKVEPGQLRFDYNHPKAPSDDELVAIQTWVNARVGEGHAVETVELPIDEARERGAKALFGEKYGETVRVVTMGSRDVSIELCGGCHVSNTADIGAFRLVRDEASAAGIRRIVAVAGDAAAALASAEADLTAKLTAALGGGQGDSASLSAVQRRLKVQGEAVVGRVEALVSEATELASAVGEAVPTSADTNLDARVEALQEAIRRLRKAAAAAQGEAAVAQLASQLDAPIDAAGIPLVVARLTGVDGKGLRQAGDLVKSHNRPGCVVLAADGGGKVALLVLVSQDLVKRGLKAGDLVRQVAGAVGGKGGGKPDQAQGGGTDVGALDAALAAVEPSVAEWARSGTLPA